MTSRSIIKDIVYEKVNKSRFKSHLEAIKNPYSVSKHHDSFNLELIKKLSKNKKGKLIANESIDFGLVENRSLVRRMNEI